MTSECESCAVLTAKLAKARHGGNNAIKAANRYKSQLENVLRTLDNLADTIESTLNGDKK